MKEQLKRNFTIGLGFGAEMVFFILAGMFITKSLGNFLISFIFGIIIAGFVGKLIEKDAIEKYKEGNKVKI